MLGHSLPETLYQNIKQKKKLYVYEKDGKPILEENFDPVHTVGIVLYKNDPEVFYLTEQERSEMNKYKKPLITLGSNKDISEVFIPDRYFENMPFVGRPFLHGLLDCYTLIRDYYRRNFNILLPTNMQRNWEWWTEGSNLYVDNAGQYGFEQVNEIKAHDIIVMSLNSPVPNHGAVYVGNNKVMHHVAGRFSTIEDLKAIYKHSISVIYRHKDVN